MPVLVHFVHEEAPLRITFQFQPAPLNWRLENCERTLNRIPGPVNLSRYVLFRLLEDCQNPIEHMVESLGNIARQESNNKISVLLKQCVLMPVSSVCVGISQVPFSVEFDNYV
jgi:hypothetical protein